MKVLVVGAGGREHCLAWKIGQSSLVKELYCAPGNGGTSLIARNVDIKATDIDGLLDFALKNNIDLTVVGPEAPLVSGIVDRFEENRLKIFGPKKDASILEGSKVFAKNIMRKFNIPTADFEVFDDASLAKDYVRKKGTPIVIKADGLAAGKGVIVARSEKEAQEAIDSIMVHKKFGVSGERIVIEDCLVGEEASILAFTDGESVLPLVSSQDHKPVFDNDEGPNTGGMGAYAPAPVVSSEIFKKVKKEIFYPLIRGLKKEGRVYKGIVYAGLMIKDNQPYVLEFNVRFGDPETQAILPKLKTDLVEVILSVIDNGLDNIELEWDERVCICVVLASGGYPASYQKGKEIRGLKDIERNKNIFVFHAGTMIEKIDGKEVFLTNGGRVLNVVGLGPHIREAQNTVYEAVKKIYFEGMHYRHDIGRRALKFSA